MPPKRLLLTLAATAAACAIALPVWWYSRPAPAEATIENGFVWPSGETDFYVRDAVAGHLHVPNAQRRYRWPEHPAGRMRLKTNDLGFREDEATSIEPAPGIRRILVTGDSHTDGVVENSESFANLLERRLGARFEVINGGVGYYGPYNYLGLLERFLDLRPAVFVVVSYTGNDFLDTVRTAAARQTIAPQPRSIDYQQRLSAASAIDSGAVGQFFNSVLFFASYPRLRDTAVELAADRFGAIAELCRRHDIELLVCFLPSKFEHEFDRRKDAGSVRRLVTTLGLTRDHVEIHQRMTEALTRRLRDAGIRVVDLLPELRRHDEKLYWDLDAHLSTRGHEVVADVLFEALGPLLGRH